MEHVCIQSEIIGTLKTKAENFEQWQKAQNGTLGRLETKIDKIYWGLAGFAVSVILLLVGIIVKG